jgi:monofunctional biosynthetic peptidoglycan transglycosylase
MFMLRLLLFGLFGLILTGCAVSANNENTLSGRADLPEEEPAPLPGTLLFDFESDSQPWFSVDDNVMGGVSSSAGQILDSGALLFSGTMSLDNNGGFSSIRSPWNPIDLSFADGVIIRVLGDGKIYRLRIRTTTTGSDVAYNSFFETEKDTWTTVYLPFQTMVPTLRGFRVNTGELDPATISSFGFMLSDKQEGEFALQVDWIRAVAEEEVLAAE